MAGINTQTLQWVRPITDSLHCEVPLTSTLNMDTNKQIRPLDIIELEITEYLPLKYQRENWLCRPDTIVPKGSVSVESVYSKLIPQIESKTWFLADASTKIDPDVYKRYTTNAPSLALIEVANGTLFHNHHGARRISFHHGGTNWDLPFTDDFYEGGDADFGLSLLCISVGEEWKPNWETSAKTWHYKLVAGLISLPSTGHLVKNDQAPNVDSLLSFCERLFKFIPEVVNERQKPARFASSGWVYQNRVSLSCPTCDNPNLLVFRKHFRKFAREMHYWGIVCSVCKKARDSKDFSKDFIQQITVELENSSPIADTCGTCVSNLKNY